MNGLSQERRKLQLMAFKIGGALNLKLTADLLMGVIVRLNQKTATIETSDGRGWRVSSQLLRKVVDVKEYHGQKRANFFLPTMDTIDAL